MFWTRLRSSIIIIVVALLTMISGGVVLYCTTLAVSLIGLQEFYKAAGVHTERFTVLEVVGYIGAAGYYAYVYFLNGQYGLLPVVALLLLLLVVYVACYPKYDFKQAGMAFFGICYVAVMLSFIYTTRMLDKGEFLVWMIFLCSWGCDTCAYCVGMLFGKHKMSPILSPKKSVEGAVGGVVGAALLGMLYAYLVTKYSDVAISMILCAAVCAGGALISMLGDLAASAIKRNAGIKDYGRLIPGHGGILDRFDSVIFAAPVIYFMALLLGEYL